MKFTLPTFITIALFSGTTSAARSLRGTGDYTLNNASYVTTTDITNSNLPAGNNDTKRALVDNVPLPENIMETKVITNVGVTWETVTLTKAYVSPIAVCSVCYTGAATEPNVVRMQNVSPSSFEIRLQIPGELTAPSTSKTVNCLVVEEGSWEMPNGRKIEAQSYTSISTAAKYAWTGVNQQQQSYYQSYVNPVVLGQVMTYNDPLWSVFFASNGSQDNPPTNNALFTGKHVGEDTNKIRANEIIGFIVMEGGHDASSPIENEASVGSDSVDGYGNSIIGRTYTYQQTFVDIPQVTIVSSAAMDGGDGGWPTLVMDGSQSTDTFQVLIDEDVVGDTERSHTNEQVAYATFSSQGIIPLLSTTPDVIYEDRPDMTDSDIAKVMNWIKAEVTMVRNPFCWKDSYGRGVGTIPGRVADCPAGYTNDGATCRRPTDDILSPSKTPNCPSGYTNLGLTCQRNPHDIYSPSKLASCPSGWRNFGLTCTEKLGTGGCNWYKPWKCDTFNILSNTGKMNCPTGYFVSKTTGRCHKNCPAGYTNTGESCHRPAKTLTSGSMKCPDGYFLNKVTARCHKNCQDGYTNTGEFCHRPLIVKGIGAMTCKKGEEKKGARCYPAGGNLGSCFNNEENDAGLCYKKCSDGFSGVGPVCWQTCDNSQVDCAGAGCAKTSLDCGLSVANQVIAPVIIAANVLTMGVGGKVVDAGKDAANTVLVGSKHVAYTSNVGKYALKALNFLQTINKTGAANPTVIQRIWSMSYGGYKHIRTVKFVGKASAAAYRAQDAYRKTFADEFDKQTSKEIEQELDSHFTKETAKFLKESWADIQMQELAEVNGWAAASAALAVTSLVDPTGVVGAVEAYAKPTCKAIIPFPCTEFNTDTSTACS